MHSKKSISAKIKEVGKHGLVYGVGTIFESLLQIVLIPLYANKFLPSEYGAFALIQVSAAMAAAFFYLGGSTALNRFFFEAHDSTEQSIWFSNILVLTLAGSAIMYTLIFLGSEQFSYTLFGSKSYLLTVRILFLSTAFSLLNTLFYLLSRLLKLSTWFVLLKLISLVVSWTSIMFFISASDDVMSSTALGLLLGQVLVFILMLIRFSSFLRFKLRKSLIIRFLGFGLPMALSGLVFMAIDWSLRYTINLELGQQSLGQYSLGFKIGSLIQAGYVMPFSLIWGTVRMEYMRDSNTVGFFSKALSYFVIMGLMIVLFLSLNSDDILVWISSNSSYSMVSEVIPIILLSQLVLGTINILDFGIFKSNKTMYYPIFYGVALFVVNVFSRLLIPLTGIVGSAVAHLLGSIVLVFLIFRQSTRLFKINVDYRLMVCSLISLVLVVWLGRYLDSIALSMGPRILLKNILGVGLFIVLVSRILPKDDWNSILVIIGDLRRKLNIGRG